MTKNHQIQRQIKTYRSNFEIHANLTSAYELIHYNRHVSFCVLCSNPFERPTTHFPLLFIHLTTSINLLRQIVTAFNSVETLVESFRWYVWTGARAHCWTFAIGTLIYRFVPIHSHYNVYYSNRLISREYCCAKILIGRVLSIIKYGPQHGKPT